MPGVNMKQIVLLLAVVLLSLTSACNYSFKKAHSISAVYQHSVKTGKTTTITYLILKQGSFQVSDSVNGVLWDGSLTTDANQMVFTPEHAGKAAKAACPNLDAFTYNWTFDEKTQVMTLVKAEDGCAYRAELLTAHGWEQVKSEAPKSTEAGGAE